MRGKDVFPGDVDSILSGIRRVNSFQYSQLFFHFEEETLPFKNMQS